ncbi:16S rRNA (uracil(1498)-N(3))-methyltransferase [Sedimenticola sp.]|uniref:16S rRNA (uracil(1498)-N(3))-methyltransferase n=1 Tax=Sedimenticola sp. TaxID=1940285 RepID=UPI003D0D1C64
MQQHRIYTHQTLQPGTALTLEEGPARHLTQVLRLKSGAEIILFNGDGHDYSAHLDEVSRRRTSAIVEQRLEPAEPPAALQIHLAIGISKGERMDFAIQKAVELGVTDITPLITERCMVRLPSDRQEKRLQHWQQVIIAACEQSGRRYIPTLNPVMSLTDWLPSRATQGGILLDHRAEHALHELATPADQVTLLIGPEGGLSAEERKLAAANGFNGVRMGPRVMRTETAPLAAIAAIQTLWGDFR